VIAVAMVMPTAKAEPCRISLAVNPSYAGAWQIGAEMQRHRCAAFVCAGTLLVAGIGLAASSSQAQRETKPGMTLCSGSPTMPIGDLATRAARSLSPAEECGLKPKDFFKECDLCPELVVVPAGSFEMGASDREQQSSLRDATRTWRRATIRDGSCRGTKCGLASRLRSAALP
jgi:formylglycine-generating enzyme required for sulfatase activity